MEVDEVVEEEEAELEEEEVAGEEEEEDLEVLEELLELLVADLVEVANERRKKMRRACDIRHHSARGGGETVLAAWGSERERGVCVSAGSCDAVLQG